MMIKFFCILVLISYVIECFKSGNLLKSTSNLSISMKMNDQPIKIRNYSVSKVKYIALVSSMLSLTATTIGSLKSSAGFFTSSEQDLVNDIARYQKPVSELLSQLRPSDIPNAIGVYQKQQILKGGKEDSDVVLNYLESYISPLQEKMAKAAPQLQIERQAKERLQTLPLLMKGHIVELNQAIESQKADSQAREVEEVLETLNEFLSIASTKYTVAIFNPPKPASDAELFGPFGCGFYGKVRVPGSNACVDSNQ